MRKLLALLLLVGTTSATYATNWRTDYEKARQDARNNNKLILLKFSGSDWCLPCIRMEKDVFAKDPFNQFASQHLEMVNADFPRMSKHRPTGDVAKQNNELAAQFDKEGHFPYTVLMKPDGTILKTWDGYHGEKPDDLVQQIAQYANNK